jgi:predicted RNA binding protein YcfA (HicA-like mRNA interferase family)
MSDFPSLSGRALLRALQQFGFSVLRVKGSHHFIGHADGRTTVVPIHRGEDLGAGILSKILRDCELTREQIRRAL